jgi:hypothetical protein
MLVSIPACTSKERQILTARIEKKSFLRLDVRYRIRLSLGGHVAIEMVPRFSGM